MFEYTFLKKEWGVGPWNSEPDKITWVEEGLPCVMRRNNFGSWCGYVGIPRWHPWYGKGYDDVDDVDVSVHGGLTYAEELFPGLPSDPGIPIPGFWWFGFDCAHYGDLAPYMAKSAQEHGWEDIYRDKDYVMKEVNSLAKQLVKVRPGPQTGPTGGSSSSHSLN